MLVILLIVAINAAAGPTDIAESVATMAFGLPLAAVSTGAAVFIAARRGSSFLMATLLGAAILLSPGMLTVFIGPTGLAVTVGLASMGCGGRRYPATAWSAPVLLFLAVRMDLAALSLVPLALAIETEAETLTVERGFGVVLAGLAALVWCWLDSDFTEVQSPNLNAAIGAFTNGSGLGIVLATAGMLILEPSVLRERMFTWLTLFGLSVACLVHNPGFATLAVGLMLLKVMARAVAHRPTGVVFAGMATAALPAMPTAIGLLRDAIGIGAAVASFLFSAGGP